MRTLSSSLTRSLCDQIFTAPIHWTKAIDFPETATHAVDFGPGGLSGIGPLTARNLDGRGVRIIVVGDRAKGDAELYSSTEVKYEAWWGKDFAPSLVKSRYVPTESSPPPVMLTLGVAMALFTLIRLSLASSESLPSWSRV